jgi:hypothetical protein
MPNNRFREWLTPLVYLSNNWLSSLGVFLATGSGVSWLFLLPISMRGQVSSPYIGILVFLCVPAVFFAGLLLIPAGIYLRKRKERASGTFPLVFAEINLRNVAVRRLLYFIAATTAANVIIAGQFTYSAVNYMDSVGFCGQTCHTVMQPEFSAYQGSPHSRVECVQCHIGPGASWFVKSKLSGMGQVFAVAFNSYPRPIPTPVHSLRPARETCEACHWPQKFEGDRLRIVTKFNDDETNSATRTVLLMRIGGGSETPGGRVGIHGIKLGKGVTIRYAPSDESRQTIPWVERTDASGNSVAYTASGAKPEAIKKLPVRTMDCVDCHNRPTHTFVLPERAMDTAMAAGDISPALPFVKKKGLEILKATYASRDQAATAIPAALHQYYREAYPNLDPNLQPNVDRAANALVAIYNKNIFPAMKVTWGTYPLNIGHTDFPGCFRCHDDSHASAGGKTITQDCDSCHHLLAMEEPSPKILTDLGITPAAAGSAPPEKTK